MTPCLHNAKPTLPPPLSAQIQKAGPSSQVIRRAQTRGRTLEEMWREGPVWGGGGPSQDNTQPSHGGKEMDESS